MQINSKRLLINLSRVAPHKDTFKIMLYPAEKPASDNANLIQYYLNASDIRSDVDIISIVGELVKAKCDKMGTSLESVSPYFDGISIAYTNNSNFITQYMFTYDSLKEVGNLERKLIEYDLKFNFAVTVSTLLIIEALSYVREVFKWKDLWMDLV